MIIVGIDPGLNATGFGVITAERGALRFLDAGTIRPPARQALARRLAHLYDAVSDVITTHRPETLVLESLYTHAQYLTTASLMAHARGVVCLAAAHHHLEVIDYPPTRIKKALTGYGSASKEQVARLVARFLGVRDPSWSSDATDALAIAITHAHVSHAAARHAAAAVSG